MATSIPREFVCPIGHTLMIDPVNVCENSHIFDRRSIQKWVETSIQNRPTVRPVCPECRGNLGSFRPERSLKERITSWLTLHPESAFIAELAVSSVEVSRSMNTPLFVDGDVRLKLSTFEDGPHTCVHVVAETKAASKQPACYIIGLDCSGSMNDLVDETNKEILYTRLDLAKYLISCLGSILSEQDSLAIVKFSGEATVVMNPTVMNVDGMNTLRDILGTIRAQGSTNIYDCIDKMMKIANEPSLTGRAIFGALLTDGAEMVIPAARGTVHAMSSRVMANSWIFSTFGFGYDIQSELLYKLANMESSGGGSFGFIPDLTMIGTVLINWLANCMIIGNRNTKLSYISDSKTQYLNIGPLAIGQPKEFLIKFPKGTTSSFYSGEIVLPIDEGSAFVSEFVIARAMLIEAIEASMVSCKSKDIARAQAELKRVLDIFESSSDSRVKSLLRDIKSDVSSEGQIGLAPEFWNRWGRHYMLSYISHQNSQKRLNFADPGSLIYGGDDTSLFGETIKTAEAVYLTKEPPIPTGISYGGVSFGSPLAGSAMPTPIPPRDSLSSYIRDVYTSVHTNRGTGGCFAANTKVRMYDGTFKNIQDICPGDKVYNTYYSGGNVKAIVTLGHSGTTLELSRVGDCLLSPYHPYLNDEGEWTCGADTVGVETVPCDVLYNLVLDQGHIISVGGLHACTLGHNLTEKGVTHPFFGSQKVIDCLSKCEGWEKGHPVYKNLDCRRENGVVIEWFDNPPL